MRAMKIIVAAGLILALSGSAWAITFNQTWNGPVIFHITSRDSGTIYNGAPIKGPGSLPGEDSWGVFSIDSIEKAMAVGPNNITGLGEPLWSANTTDGKELVGMLYGEQDLGHSTVGAQQHIEGVGVNVTVFEQTFGLYNKGIPGSAARVMTSPGEYVSIGDDVSSSLWLSGTSTPGFLGSLFPGVTEFVGTYDYSVPTGSVSGSAHMYLSVGAVDYDGDGNPDVGSANQSYDTNFFQGSLGSADFSLDMTTYQNNPTNTPGGFDWTVTNSDPLKGWVVPEPLTMLSVFGAVVGIGGYIRKRRTA